MPVTFTYRELLSPLEGTREARKLAMMASQVKIEQDLLAEVMFNGNERLPDLDFYLEENRRDLTVRMGRPTTGVGPLIEWVKAKMCATDDLARELTDPGGRVVEYRNRLKNDVDKPIVGLGPDEHGARLTSLLFAIHHEAETRRHKYRRGFKLRTDHDHTALQIAKEASLHVRTVIAPYIKREVVEDFAVHLDTACRLHVFVLRAAAHAEISAGPPSILLDRARIAIVRGASLPSRRPPAYDRVQSASSIAARRRTAMINPES